MYYFFTLLGSFGLMILVIFLRFLAIKSGLKDRNYSQVQRIPKKEKVERRAPSPGSQLARQLPPSEEPEPLFKAPKRPFASHEDLRRSFLIDTILDKPRWKNEM